VHNNIYKAVYTSAYLVRCDVIDDLLLPHNRAEPVFSEEAAQTKHEILSIWSVLGPPTAAQHCLMKRRHNGL